jgi:hypothetical protein
MQWAGAGQRLLNSWRAKPSLGNPWEGIVLAYAQPDRTRRFWPLQLNLATRRARSRPRSPWTETTSWATKRPGEDRRCGEHNVPLASIRVVRALVIDLTDCHREPIHIRRPYRPTHLARRGPGFRKGNSGRSGRKQAGSSRRATSWSAADRPIGGRGLPLSTRDVVRVAAIISRKARRDASFSARAHPYWSRRGPRPVRGMLAELLPAIEAFGLA